jgi:single-stranded DNA-binding protein
MNVAILSGVLSDNAIVRGKQTKALAFIIATSQPKNGGDEKEIINFVPCVMFNPSPEIEEVLTTNGKGIHCEFQGRLNTSKFDQDDRPRFSTEVVIFNRSFVVLS